MDRLIKPATVVQTVKLISTGAAFLVAGYSLSFSQNILPALYDHRPQFSTIVCRQIASQANLIPALGALSTISFGYLGYALPEKRSEWIKAAVLTGLVFPWHALVVRKSVWRLKEIAGSVEMMAKSEQNLEHRRLLVRWVKQNYAGVALQLAGAVVGARAMLGV